jgi:5-methylcytosine-specific restriction enzyme subunit McrC
MVPVEITESVKSRSMLKRQMVCTYDEFSTNSYMNRILKTTMELLIRSDIAKSRKKELRKLLVFFGEVDTLDPYMINWNQQVACTQKRISAVEKPQENMKYAMRSFLVRRM